MRNMCTIFGREFASYFKSPIGYIYLIVFLLINNVLFITPFFTYPRAEMRQMFNFLPFLLCVLIPLITMRLWAEDRKENTIEMLLTFPMKPFELVLGKFTASFAFFLIALLGTATIPLMISLLGGKPDWGVIITSYLGAVFIGAFFLAVGIFLSALVRDQIIAAVLSLAACFLFFLSGTDFIATILDGWQTGLGTAIKKTFGVTSHYETFTRGIIAMPDLIYFFIWCSLFLFLNGFFLEGRSRPNASAAFGTSLILCLAIGITFNLIASDLALGRFDCTEGNIHTLANATKTVIQKLKVPVKVNFYVTPKEDMPTEFQDLQQNVIDKLNEMKIAGNNKFEYQVIPLSARKLLERVNQGGEDSLSVSDIKNAGEFLAQLRQSSDPVSSYLRSQLSTETQQYMKNQQIAAEDMLRMVVDDLNRVVQSSGLYDEKRFAGVRLSDKTKRMLQQNVQEREVAVLNRSLLEEAYAEYIKTRQDKSVEEHLLDKGVQPFSVKIFQQDQETTRLVYSSLGIAYLDKKEEILPRIMPQNLADLEYQLVSNVQRLARDKKPVIALIAPKESNAMPAYMRQLYMQMGKPLPPEEDPYQPLEKFLEHDGYEVKRIALNKKELLPDEYDALVVINPREFNERQKWEVARALHSGKNVMLAVQTYNFNYNVDRNGLSLQKNDEKPEVNDWLSRYGIGVDDAILMDVNYFPITFSDPSNPLAAMLGMGTPINLPTHIMVMQQNMNSDSALVSRSQQIPYLWGTALELKEKKPELKVTTLLSTSPNAWKAAAGKQLSESDVQPPVSGSQYPLMIMLEGQFPDIYKEQARPKWPKAKTEPGMPPEPEDDKDDQPEPPVKTVTAKPAKLLLVGCAQLFRKELIRNTITLFSNSIETLALSGELVSIRSRNMVDRGINRPSEGQRSFWKALHFVLLPLFLVVVGLGYISWRYMRRKQYLLEIQKEA
jgi:ABC-type transport system involved in multi-copper enzyme maturation permease subunit